MSYRMLWPLRPSTNPRYVPERPVNSWTRPGYAREYPYNPHGWHQATDFDIAIDGTLGQLPWRAELWWKGLYGDLGRVLEVRLREGPFSGKFWRYCHLESYTSRPLHRDVNGHKGSLPQGFAVCRADNTGRTSGNHLHAEIGDHPLESNRFPKRDFYKYALQAFEDRRFAA